MNQTEHDLRDIDEAVLAAINVESLEADPLVYQACLLLEAYRAKFAFKAIGRLTDRDDAQNFRHLLDEETFERITD